FVHVGTAIPRGAAPDPPEAPATGPDVRFQHFRHGIAEGEVDAADDAGADPCRAVAAALAPGCDACHELRLPHRLQRMRATCPVHRMALDEHGGHNVVPCRDVL